MGSAEAAIAAAGSDRPDIFLLDLELPDMSGIEAIPGLTAVALGARVVVLTAYDTEDGLARPRRARGYL